MLKIVIKKRVKLKTKSFLTEGLTSSSTRSSTLNINTLTHSVWTPKAFNFII